MSDRLRETIAEIPLPDERAMAHAALRQSLLTKPSGALGRLESLSIAIAGATANPLPVVTPYLIVLAAASHAVAEEGVSAYPAAVTRQMMLNFLSGGAAINVLSRAVGAEVVVVDAGVDPPLAERPGLVSLHLGTGSRNFARHEALSGAIAADAVSAGIDLAARLIGNGARLLGLGDMGIGNTTAAAAIAAVVLARPAAEVTGYGTMIDDAAFAAKVRVIDEAVSRYQGPPTDALGLLQAFGGSETAVLTGVILGAAARRIPVVVDGFPTTAAALAADCFTRSVRPYLIAAHQSAEPGHRACLEYLGLEPLLDLGLRLGEGTGAALAFPLINSAVLSLREMATFAEAGLDRPDAS